MVTPAEFLELAATRQSTRAYDKLHYIEREKLERIVEAAHLAPSACNAQPWHMIVVDDKDICGGVAEALSSTGMNKFAWEATAHIVIVEERPNFTSWIGGVVKNKHFPHIDCGILSAYITMAATCEGLGSCIVGWFDEKKLRKLLGIPRTHRVLLDIVLGYTSAPLRPKVRKPLDEVITYNKYSTR